MPGPWGIWNLNKVLWFWGTKLGHGTQQEGYHPFLSGAASWGSDDSHLRCRRCTVRYCEHTL